MCNLTHLPFDHWGNAKTNVFLLSHTQKHDRVVAFHKKGEWVLSCKDQLSDFYYNVQVIEGNILSGRSWLFSRYPQGQAGGRQVGRQIGGQKQRPSRNTKKRKEKKAHARLGRPLSFNIQSLPYKHYVKDYFQLQSPKGQLGLRGGGWRSVGRRVKHGTRQCVSYGISVTLDSLMCSGSRNKTNTVTVVVQVCRHAPSVASHRLIPNRNEPPWGTVKPICTISRVEYYVKKWR